MISEQTKTWESTREIVYLSYDRIGSGMVASELEKAGYRIKLTSGIGETILCLRESRYAALIVGPLVQAKDRTLLVSELHRRKSNTKIVFLNRDHGPREAGALGADAEVSVQNGADDVLRTLKKLLVSSPAKQ